MEVKYRIVSIDNIKVICIILMVLCHFGFKNDIVIQFIYGFHMPSLFIISGYLYKRRDLKKELYSFGIPIILYSLLSIMWMLYWHVWRTNDETINEFFCKLIPGFIFTNHGEFHTPFTGIWFIIGLLCTRLFFNWVNIEKYGAQISLICLLLTELNTKYGFSISLKECTLFKPIMIFPLFYGGYLLKKYNVVITRFVAILLFISYLAICWMNGRVDMYGGSYGTSYILAIIGAFLLFISMYRLFCISFGNIVKTLSIGTFLILGTHSLVFPLFVVFLNRYIHIKNVSVVLCVILFFVVIFPLIKYCNENYPIVLGKLSKK